MAKIVRYVEGGCRNDPYHTRSHIYAETKAGNYWPMCGYGWNRSNGNRLSIFRGHQGGRGTCKLCKKNIDSGKRPHWRTFPHKTRWL